MQRKLGIKYEEDGLYLAIENNSWIVIDNDDTMTYNTLLSNIHEQNNVVVLIPGHIYAVQLTPERIIHEYKYLQKGICKEKPYEEWKTVPKSAWDKKPFFLKKKEVVKIVL